MERSIEEFGNKTDDMQFKHILKFIEQQQASIQHQQELISRQLKEMERCCQTILHENKTLLPSTCTPRKSLDDYLASPVVHVKSTEASFHSPRSRKSSINSCVSVLSPRRGSASSRYNSGMDELQRLRNQRISERVRAQKAAQEFNIANWNAQHLRVSFLEGNSEAQDFVKSFSNDSWKCLLPGSGEALLMMLADNQDSSLLRRTEKFEAHLKNAQATLKEQGQSGINIKKKMLLWKLLNSTAWERHTTDIDVFKSLVECLVSTMKQQKESGVGSPRLGWEPKEYTSDAAGLGSAEEIRAFFAVTHLRILCRLNPGFPHSTESHWSIAAPPPSLVPTLLENRQIVASNVRGMIEALQNSMEPVLNELLLRAILQLMINLLADRLMNDFATNDPTFTKDLMTRMKYQAGKNAKGMAEALAVLNRACTNIFAPSQHQTPNRTMSYRRSLHTPEKKAWEGFHTTWNSHSTGKDLGLSDIVHRSSTVSFAMRPGSPGHAPLLGMGGNGKVIEWQTCLTVVHFIYSLCNADTGCIVALANSHYVMLRLTEWLAADEMRSGWADIVRILWLLVRHDDATVKERVGIWITPVLVERLVDNQCIEGGHPRTERGVQRKVLNCLSLLALMPDCAVELTRPEVLEVLRGLVAGKDDVALVTQERAVEILGNLALTLPNCTTPSQSAKAAHHRVLEAHPSLRGLNIENELMQMIALSESQPQGGRVVFAVCLFMCSQILAGNLDADVWDSRIIQWTSKLDVACVNGGVYYENIPRAALGSCRINALFQQLLSSDPGVQMFGLFLFAHYSFKKEDQFRLANTTVNPSLADALYAEKPTSTNAGHRRPRKTRRNSYDMISEDAAKGFSADLAHLGHNKRSTPDVPLLDFEEKGQQSRRKGSELSFLHFEHSQSFHGQRHVSGFQFLLDLLVYDRIGSTQATSNEKLLCLKLMAKGLANLCSNNKNLEKAKSASILPAFKKLLDSEIRSGAVLKKESCSVADFSVKTPLNTQRSEILVESLSSYAFYRKDVLWYRLDRPVTRQIVDGFFVYKVQFSDKCEELKTLDTNLFRPQCLPSEINLTNEVVACIEFVGKHQGVMGSFSCTAGLQLLMNTCHSGFPQLKSICLRQFLSIASQNIDELFQIEIAASLLGFITTILEEKRADNETPAVQVNVLLSLKTLRIISQKVSFYQKAGKHIPPGWNVFHHQELWKNDGLISSALACLEGTTDMDRIHQMSFYSTTSEISPREDSETKLQCELEIAALSLFNHLLQVFDAGISLPTEHLKSLRSKCLSKLRAHVQTTYAEMSVFAPCSPSMSREQLAHTQDWRKMLLTILMQLSYYEDCVHEIWGTDLEDVLETCRDLISMSRDVCCQAPTASPDAEILTAEPSTPAINAVKSTFELSGQRDAALLEIFTLEHFAVSLVTRLARNSGLNDAIKKTMSIFVKRNEFAMLLERTLCAPFSRTIASSQEEDLQKALCLDLLELLLAIMPRVSLRQVLNPRLCFAIGSLCHSLSGALRLAAVKLVKEMANDISFKDVLLSTFEDDNALLECDDQLLLMPGCVPALIKMVRSKDALEIELGMEALLQLGQFSQRGLDVIAEQGGVAAMVCAANSGLINERTQGTIATLLQEFSIMEEHRQQLQKNGGLLVLISYVNDPHVDSLSKVQAELACPRFGSEQIELNLALLQQTTWLPTNSKSALAAAIGLVQNLQHSANAARIISKKNFASVLGLISSGIPALQLAAVAAFHLLLSHEHQSLISVPLSRKKDLARSLAAICRSPEQVAAHTLQLALLKKVGRTDGHGGHAIQAHLPSWCSLKERQAIQKMALECLILICESSLHLAHTLITNGSAKDVVLLLGSGCISVQETALRTLLVLAVSGPNQLRSFSSPVLNLIEMYHFDVQIRLMAREVRVTMWGPELRNELRPLREWKADDACVWLACLGLGDLGPQMRRMIRMAALAGKWKSNPIATLEGGAGVTKDVLLSLDTSSISILTNTNEKHSCTILKALRVLHYLSWMQSRNLDGATNFKDPEENYYRLLHEANIYECQRVMQQTGNKNHAYKITKGTLDFEQTKKSVQHNRVEAMDNRESEKQHSVWIELSPLLGQRESTNFEDENIVVEKLKEVHDEQNRSHLIVLDEADTTNAADKHGTTELMGRVINNDIRMVNRLLSTGKMKVDLQDKMGRTALHHAIIKGWDFCAFLVLLAVHTNKAIPDHHFVGDLTTEYVMKLFEEEIVNKAHQASGSGAIAASSASLQKSKTCHTFTMCLNLKDNQGKTVLHYVLGSHQLADSPTNCATRPKAMIVLLTRALLAAGVDANIADDAGRSALHYVLDGSLKLDQEDFLSCVLHQSDPNRQDNNGCTPLHYVVDSNDEKLSLVQQLLQSKAECNIQDKEGHSPLHIACIKGHIDVVHLLMKNNAIVSIQDNMGRTSLHFAAQHLHLRVATKLIKNSIEVDMKDFLGRTALHYACHFKVAQASSVSQSMAKILLQQQEALIQLLLRNKADLETLDNFGVKPLDFSKEYQNTKAVIEKAVEDQVSYELHAIEQPGQLLASFACYLLSIFHRTRQALRRSSPVNDGQAWNVLNNYTENLKRKMETARASSEIFKDERTQKAVNQEWKQSFRHKEQKRMLLYLCFLCVFSGIAILEGGRLKLDGIFLIEGLRSIFLERPFNRESKLIVDPVSFYEVQTRTDWFAWALGPFEEVFHADPTTWYEGEELKVGGLYVNTFLKVIGPVRLSQWRTGPDTCPIREMAHGVFDFCFGELTEETKVTESYGPEGEFHYDEEARFVKSVGAFAIYGAEPGAHTVELPALNVTELVEKLEHLEEAEWIDGSTRAVMTELFLYSEYSRRVVLAQFLAEFPSSGGLAQTRAFFHIYNAAQMTYTPVLEFDYVMLILELLFCVFVVWLAWLLVQELLLKRHLMVTHTLAFLDIVAMVLYCAIIATRIRSVTLADEIEWSETETWVDISALINILRLHQFSVSLGLLLAWMKLMHYFANAFQTLYIMVKMIEILIGELISSFAVLLTIFCVGFGLSNYAIGSQIQFSQRTLFHAILAMYRNSLGDHSFDVLQEETQAMGFYWQSLILVVFTILVVIVLFTLLVAILTNKFEESRKEAKSKWCENQAHSLHLPKVLQRRNMARHHSRLKQGESKRKQKNLTGIEQLSDLFEIVDPEILNAMVHPNGVLKLNTSNTESIEKTVIGNLKTVFAKLLAIIEGGSNLEAAKALDIFGSLGESFQMADQLTILVEADYVLVTKGIMCISNHSTKRAAVTILCSLSKAMVNKAKDDLSFSTKHSNSSADVLELFRAFQTANIVELMTNELNFMVTILQNAPHKGESYKDYTLVLEVIGNILWIYKAFAKSCETADAAKEFWDFKERVKKTIFMVNRWAPDWNLKMTGDAEKRVDPWTLPMNLVCTYYSSEVVELIMKGSYGCCIDQYIQAVLTFPQMIEMCSEAEVQKWITNNKVIDSLCSLLRLEEEPNTSSSSVRNVLLMNDAPPAKENFFEGLAAGPQNRKSSSQHGPGDRDSMSAATDQVTEREVRRFGVNVSALEMQCHLNWDLTTRNQARWGAAKSVLMITEILVHKTSIKSFLEEYNSKHHGVHNLICDLFSSVTKMLLAVMESHGTPMEASQMHHLIQLGIKSLNNLTSINSQSLASTGHLESSALGKMLVNGEFRQLSLQLSKYWMNAMFRVSKNHLLSDIHALEILPSTDQSKRKCFHFRRSFLNFFGMILKRKVKIDVCNPEQQAVLSQKYKKPKENENKCKGEEEHKSRNSP